MLSFLILTTADLAEAYFLGSFLESAGAPFALVNIVGRPARNSLRVLARLRRNRGIGYVADLLLARLADRVAVSLHRQWPGRVAPDFPEIDAATVRGIRARHPHLDCRDPHASCVLDFVRANAPDYILLAGAPILRSAFYGLARVGALNRHLGLLPEARGSDCALWAFALGRPESAGYSIHVVNERVDGGDVIVRRPVPVRDDPTLEDYLRRLRREGSEAFVRVIRRLLDGATLRPLPQARLGTYFPPAGWTTQRRAMRTFARLPRGRCARRDVVPSDPEGRADALPG